jgi:hypothetical protein
MTIKQLGGVFGRNPTFEDVTIEGTLTFDGDIDINSDLRVDGDLDVNGTVTADRASSDGTCIDIQKDGVSLGTLGASVGDLFIQGKLSGHSGLRFDSSAIIPFRDNSISSNTTDLGLSNVRFKDIYLGGNVVVSSGSGIDFSATSGTGTSELLDDYEEGTWTPTYLGSVSNPTITYDIQVGLYVKIGRLCHAVLRIRTDSVSGGSGNLRIGGLPFLAFSAPTSSMSGGITVNRADSFTTNTPAFGVISGGADYIDLNYDLAANAVTTANLTNAANSNTAIISIVYQTA